MNPSKGAILTGVSAAAFIGPFTQTVYVPSLVEIGHDLGVSVALVNLTISLFVGILALSGFVVGPLADRHGRRTLLLPGLVVFILGSLCCLLAQDYWLFLLGRAVQAIGVGVSVSIAAVVIGDIYPPDQRAGALSLYQLLVYLGPVLGPVVGGLIAQYLAWQWAFALLIGAGGLVLLYALRFVPETRPATLQAAAPARRAMGEVFASASARSLMLVAFSQFYGYYSFLVFLPGLLDSLFDFSVAQKGFAFIPLTAGLLLGTLGARYGLRYWSRTRVVALASWILVLDVLALWGLLAAGALGVPLLLLLLFAYGAALGFSLPAQMTILINLFTHNRATAVGAYNAIRFGGAALGPLAGAWVVHRIGPDSVFLVLGAVLLVAALFIQRYLQDPHEAPRRG